MWNTYVVRYGYGPRWKVGQNNWPRKGRNSPFFYRELAKAASERAILPLKTATREKCSKVKASNSFLKRFDIWVRAGPAELVSGGGIV